MLPIFKMITEVMDTMMEMALSKSQKGRGGGIKKIETKTKLGTLSTKGWDQEQVKHMRKSEFHLQVITENNY